MSGFFNLWAGVRSITDACPPIEERWGTRGPALWANRVNACELVSSFKLVIKGWLVAIFTASYSTCSSLWLVDTEQPVLINVRCDWLSRGVRSCQVLMAKICNFQKPFFILFWVCIRRLHTWIVIFHELLYKKHNF